MMSSPIPNLTVPVRHGLPSAVLSADDDPGMPTMELIDISLRAARAAMQIDLSEISRRMDGPPFWPNVWPGEHYRLLAALVQLIQPQVVIEIGTASGLSALAMKRFLPSSGRLITFDIVPWQNYPGKVVNQDDFADGRIVQVVADLTDNQVLREAAPILRNADLLFVDAAKDGNMEAIFLENFIRIGLKEGALLVFDDIRMLNMIGIWRQISMPKLDLTSFGHWSGTGLVRWVNVK